MRNSITLAAVVLAALVENVLEDVRVSFERFCLTAGIAILTGMMEEDASRLCGPRYGCADGKGVWRRGKVRGKVGFHSGKLAIERPRVRDGGELALPSRTMNLMLLNVSTAGPSDAAVRQVAIVPRAAHSPASV